LQPVATQWLCPNLGLHRLPMPFIFQRDGHFNKF